MSQFGLEIKDEMTVTVSSRGLLQHLKTKISLAQERVTSSSSHLIIHF